MSFSVYIIVCVFTLHYWYKTQISFVNNYKIRTNNFAPVIRLELANHDANTTAEEDYQMTMGAIKLCS